MDFFDKLGETLVSAGKDVSQRARDVSDIAKLKLDIKRGLSGKAVCRAGRILL